MERIASLDIVVFDQTVDELAYDLDALGRSNHYFKRRPVGSLGPGRTTVSTTQTVYSVYRDCLRHSEGDTPNCFLKAREKALTSV